jgi:hypothetical protein
VTAVTAIQVSTAAEKHRLPLKLVLAVIQVESGGDTYAWNPEPKYRYLWDVRNKRPFRPLTRDEILSEVPPFDFYALKGDKDQEYWAQQASWGLMQVMGAVAREHGFLGPYLTELTDPETGLEFGCAHLASQYEWANRDVTKTLAAYNGGHSGNSRPPYRNADYASKVEAAMLNI